MIALQNLSKTYGQGVSAVTALHQVDFTIAGNEFFTLLGPSGCGKTTLLRLIAGFEAPSDGAIVLDGEDIAQMPPNKRPVNTVFQNYALFPHLTVAQNIAFGLETQRRPKTEVTDTVDRMLALVQMDHLRDRKITALSGGQQQRVALARALAPKPRILLLDEPLSALDLKLRKDMQIELKRLQEETGITFIFVTHDQEEALTMSDRIAVMGGGRVHQIATPRDLYDSPDDRFVADFIGESNFLPARILSTSAKAHGVQIGGADPFDVAFTAHGPLQGEVAALVRPEDVRLEQPGANTDGCLGLNGQVDNIVFLGTDTHVYVALDDGYSIVARVQNANPVLRDLTTGGRITVAVPQSAVRLVSA